VISPETDQLKLDELKLHSFLKGEVQDWNILALDEDCDVDDDECDDDDDESFRKGELKVRDILAKENPCP